MLINTLFVLMLMFLRSFFHESACLMTLEKLKLCDIFSNHAQESFTEVPQAFESEIKLSAITHYFLESHLECCAVITQR